MSLLSKIAAAKAVRATSRGSARSSRLEPGSLPPLPDLSSLPEASRIAGLPRVDYDGADLTDELGLEGRTLELFPVQSEALAAMKHARGLLGPIQVGEGKTFVALLAGTVLDCDFALVLTKARIVNQTRSALELLRSSFRLRPIRIASYASLSRASGARLLEDLPKRFAPDRIVIVCDEAHALASLKSARTRRVIRFARANPGVRFIMLSGTLLRKSVKDCAHLAELALRDLSPFPSAGVYGTRKTSHLEAWSEVLDVRGKPSAEDWSHVAPLARFAGVDLASLRGQSKQAAIRRAFAERLRSAPGVVCSRGDGIPTSLVLVPIQLETPLVVDDALAVLKARQEDPDGEVWVDDLSKARKGRELGAGFYYRWIWEGEPDLEWLEARNDWNRCVRAELDKNHGADYDSPLLVSNRVETEIEAGVRPRAIHQAWIRWKAERHKPEPSTVPIWLSDYLAEDVLTFARGLKSPPIIWCMSRALRNRIAELGGIPNYGPDLEPPEDGTAHLCVASIQAHGTGRNLHAWSEAVIAEPPAGPWEQLLGRLHRRKQEADEVVFYYYQHVEPFRKALRSALEAERFGADTGGEKRRLLYASRAEEIKR